MLWLSTGFLGQRYGQQNYERAFFEEWRGSCTAHAAVMLLNDRDAAGYAAKFPGVRFYCFGIRPRWLGKLFFSCAAVAYTLIRRPERIVCGHMNLSFLCVLLRAVTATPYVLLTYGIDVWSDLSAARARAVRGAQALATMSAYTGAFLERLAPGAKGKTTVVPGFFDEALFVRGPKPAALRARLGLEGRRVILTVARLSRGENKGYRQVLETLPAVLARVPDAAYLIVGGGDEAEALRARAGELGVKERLVLAGFVAHEDLPEYYRLADVFVMPSAQEGFGLVFVEALACGCPVVAGNGDGASEALGQGRLGVLVDPKDTSAIARAVIDVLCGKAEPHLTDPGALREGVRAEFSRGAFSRRVNSFMERIQRV
jgi:phosphatidyl-myo-inositol dimannoside synthase